MVVRGVCMYHLMRSILLWLKFLGLMISRYLNYPRKLSVSEFRLMVLNNGWIFLLTANLWLSLP